MSESPNAVALARCPVSDPAALTALYDNNASARNQADLKALQASSAQAFVSIAMAHERVVLGESAWGWVDVFRPPRGTGPWPALLFVHGGRWQLNTSHETAFWAQACCDAGLAFVGLNFPPLAAVGLRAQIAEVAQAVQAVMARAREMQLDTARWALAGHSSGAHLALAALLRHPDGAVPKALLLLGGLYDLAPLRLTAHQEQLQFSEQDAVSCSPLQLLMNAVAPGPWRLPPALVAVGAEESSEFVRQSRALHAALARHTSAAWWPVPGTAHFDAALSFNAVSPASPLRTFITDALKADTP